MKAVHCIVGAFLSHYVLCSYSMLESTASIYLNQPKQEGIYFTETATASVTSRTAKVPVEYQLFGLGKDIDSYEFCFMVKSNRYGTIYMSEQCLPARHNQLVMNQLKEDEYTVSYYLRERIQDQWIKISSSVASNVFTVQSYESALPQIEIINHPVGDKIIVIADDTTVTGQLLLDYRYSATTLDISSLALCAKIVDVIHNIVNVNWTCLQPQDRRLVLNNLNLGQYAITLILADLKRQVNGQSGFLPSTQLQRIIYIDSLTNHLPSLIMANPSQEYVTNPSDQTAMVQIVFEVDGVVSAIQQLGVCLSIQEEVSGRELIKHSCVPPTNNVLTLQKVPLGNYLAQLVLVKARNIQAVYSQSVLNFRITIKAPTEFVPTYDWQPLRVWHTIPSGLETRLPLGQGTTQKEARIPEPWQLQLTMPEPCKYFLRMDIRRTTKIIDILGKAAEQCHQDISCFEFHLQSGASVIDFTNAFATAEDQDLFNVEKELIFRVSCRS